MLIAGDQKYFEPLKLTIASVRKYFPSLQIIVYDLGLSEYMREPVIKCVLLLILIEHFIRHELKRQLMSKYGKFSKFLE